MKFLFRVFFRWYCKTFKLRGRHRIANSIGKLIMPMGGHEVIKIGTINFPIDHNIPMYRYIYYSVYEEEFVDFLKQIIKPGDVVIDPGTNVGYISAVCADLLGNDGLVISIEPSKRCYSLIEKYLVSPRIRLFHSALYREKTNKVFVDKINVISTGYSAFSDFTGQKMGDEVYEIETLTVSDLFIQFNLERVKLLKLDIEGAELDALLGCAELLQQQKIDYILIETFISDAQIDTNKRINELLSSAGYKPFIPVKNKLIPVDFSKITNARFDAIWTYTRS